MMKTYGFAIIGCGMISNFHAKAIESLENARLVACFDVYAPAAQKLAEKTGCKAYTNLDEMLADPEVEIVTIGTPSGAHLEPALAAAKAKKHVIVEKPLEITLERCDQIINTCKENGVKLATVFHSRFHDSSITLKNAIDSGRFGKLTVGDTYVKWFRTQQYYDSGAWRGTWALDGGGALMNQCIHYTDLLQWVMGSDVDEVFAYTDRLTHPYIEAEDLGLAVLRFRSGAYATIEGTVNTYPKNLSDSMAVFGETGTVSLRGKALDEVEAWDFAEGPQSRDEAIEQFEIEDFGTGHAPLYKYAVCVINGEADDLCPATDSRAALELILAIYKSAAEGKPVRLPLNAGSTEDFTGRFDK